MVWSGLSNQDQQEIKSRFRQGESVKTLASEFGLKPQSLARKMRKLKVNKKSATAIISSVTTTLPPKPIAGDYYNNFVSQEKFEIVCDPGDRYYQRNLRIRTKSPFSGIIFSDTHFGDEDRDALNCLMRAMDVLNFDVIIHQGDALDLYGLSRYGKDRDGLFGRTVGKELKRWQAFSKELDKADNGVPKLMIGGNHMRRYYHWLDDNLGVSDIEALDLDVLMDLKGFGYMPMADQILFDPEDSKYYPDPNFSIIHGTLSRKHSGSSSRGESEKRGYASVSMGHVHRLSIATRRGMSGPIVTTEAGCMCNLSPEYDAFPDWTHGFLHFTYDGNVPFITAYQIHEGHTWINGVKV